MNKPQAELLEIAEDVINRRGSYQPLYRIEGIPSASNPIRPCTDRCDLILSNIDFINKKQVRLVDIGCNMGFNTLYLSDHLAYCAGFEVEEDYYLLCNALKKHHKKENVDFYKSDFLTNWKKILTPGNVDVLLLLSVIHQFIFCIGLEKTKNLLKNVLERVDIAFVELALKSDYIQHGKDHLLPENELDVFSMLPNYFEIKLIGNTPRPLYVIKNKKSFFSGSVNLKCWLSENPNPEISRKYYLTDSEFIKVFRFTNLERDFAYEKEQTAFTYLEKHNSRKYLSRFMRYENAGAVSLPSIEGKTLLALINEDSQQSDSLKLKMVNDILSCCRDLAACGLYHNDLCLHNIIISKNGSAFLIDYEQTSNVQIYDHIALFAWLLVDISNWNTISYSFNIFEKLRLGHESNNSRVAASNYPPPDLIESAPRNIKEIYSRLMESDTWEDFLQLSELNTKYNAQSLL